jgi:hypothetical protein
MQNEVFIGTYRIGFENVDLFGQITDNGGFFDLCPDKNKAHMKVGLTDENWDATVSIILHESMEFILLRANCAHAPINDTCASLSNRLFVLTHSQLDEACDRQAGFISDALPALETAWKKYHKKKE